MLKSSSIASSNFFTSTSILAKCSVSSLLKEPVSSLAAISLHRSIAVKIRSNPVFALSTKVSLKFNGVL